MPTLANDTAVTDSTDDRYEDFLAAVRARFASRIEASPLLFTTDVAALWETYLDAAPAESKQVRTCAACRMFIERFGGLVTIAVDGSLASAFWPSDAPPAYLDAVRALSAKVESANVTGVFRASAPAWGKRATGARTHLAVEAPAPLVWSSAVTNARQAMAAKAQEHDMLLRSLGEFPLLVVKKARALLASGSLFRSEKCEAVADWLVDLHERRAVAKNVRLRTNVTWRAVGNAPPGHCHVRSGMIGTLLEDIAANVPFDVLKARFDAKMDPLKYQRPQAPPTAGNVAQAEKIVAALKSAGALDRRFAKLADVQALWTPKVVESAPSKGGVFGHLLRTAKSELSTSGAPPTVMTWVKFAATVLPTAEAIEFLVPAGKQSYAAMVTAKNADAPPLLQWDREGRRNPVSLYVYVNGSLPETWNLRAGEHRRVTAAVLRPSMWDPERSYDHQGTSVCLVLDGARDTSHKAGGGMFPETMKSEYHPVRRTLEAYFKAAKIDGRDEAEACGICLTKGGTWSSIVRVTANGMRASYKLDRWD